MYDTGSGNTGKHDGMKHTTPENRKTMEFCRKMKRNVKNAPKVMKTR